MAKRISRRLFMMSLLRRASSTKWFVLSTKDFVGGGRMRGLPARAFGVRCLGTAFKKRRQAAALRRRRSSVAGDRDAQPLEGALRLPPGAREHAALLPNALVE